MYNIEAIENYIQYLLKHHNLSITIHPKNYDNIISTSKLMHYNIHNNPYCIYIKSCKDAQNHCIMKQKNVIEKCGGNSYCGTCYAGVKEYIYPISDGEKNVGFISVSGYKSENSLSYIKKVSEKFGLPVTELTKTYSMLKTVIPPKSEIDTLITPLCNMLELALIYTRNNNDLSLSLVQKAAVYIRKHHNRQISSTDIGNELSCNRSYLSTSFNKIMGKTIREYINELRINDAITLLLYSPLNITEIAFSVGFTDSNYFSEVFKKTTGMSPMKYRKRKSTEKQ